MDLDTADYLYNTFHLGESRDRKHKIVLLKKTVMTECQGSPFFHEEVCDVLRMNTLCIFPYLMVSQGSVIMFWQGKNRVFC